MLGNRIAEGVVFKNCLWLRRTQALRGDRSGGLVSFELTGTARQVHFETGVIDMHKSESVVGAAPPPGNPPALVLLVTGNPIRRGRTVQRRPS